MPTLICAHTSFCGLCKIWQGGPTAMTSGKDKQEVLSTPATLWLEMGEGGQSESRAKTRRIEGGVCGKEFEGARAGEPILSHASFPKKAVWWSKCSRSRVRRQAERLTASKTSCSSVPLSSSEKQKEPRVIVPSPGLARAISNA